MKRLFLVSLVTTLFILDTTAGLITISGQILNPQSNDIKIIYYNNFLEFKEMMAGASILDKDGKFGMTVEWNEPKPAFLKHGEKLYRLFLEPGCQLKLKLDPKRFYQTAAFSGRGAEINEFLTKFDIKFNEGIEDEEYKRSFKNMKLDEFVTYIDNRKEEQLKFYKDPANMTIQPSKAFENYITHMIRYSWAADRINYLWMYPFYNNKKSFVNTPSGYYEFLNEVDVHNDEALKTYYYVSFLTSYFDDQSFQKIDKKEQKRGEPSLKQYNLLFDMMNDKLSGIVRDLMLAKILYDGAKDGLSDELKPKLEEYRSININKDYFEILDDEYLLTDKLRAGNKAPDFKFPDLNGNMVSLSDFKGKVVYLEIWASWCAPCMAEVPHAKKLIERFKNEDIIFLYISIDTKAEIWQRVVFNKEIPGVHLLAGRHFESNILNLYNASGIPHYAVIDKEGKILTNNAKSPSEGSGKELARLFK